MSTKRKKQGNASRTATRRAQRRFKRVRQIEVTGNAADHADFEAFLAELQWFRDTAPRVLEFARRYPTRGRELMDALAVVLPKTRLRRNEEECLWLAYTERMWAGGPSAARPDCEPTKSERRLMVLRIGQALGREPRTIERMLVDGRELMRIRQVARSK